MTPIKRYLVEEVTVDFADGIINRREALRRLGLLGVGAATSGTLLAACGGGSEPTGSGSTSTAGATPGPAGTPSSVAGPPVTPEEITFAGPEGRTLQGAWADAGADAKGAVLVIHENKGLTDHIKSVAGRFAGDGYSALAIDLLSAEGGTASFVDPAAATAALGQVPPERFVADMKAGLDELERRVAGAKLAATGFCFGGGMTWLLLLASNEPRLAAAAPFYGPLPDQADFTGSRAAVLGIYAERDGRVNASRDAAAAALDQAGLSHEIVTFPGADHAFFNDTGPRYQPDAAAAAYRQVLDWFGQYLA